MAVVKKTNPYDNISPKKLHRFAVVIAARNESAVIGGLIDSIHKQKYPRELLDIYVIADNCTDTTAQVAQDAGAYVYERFNRQLVGKGYALDYFFKQLMKEKKDRLYDGFFVFDADNLLDENYVYEMNKVFDSGYRVITRLPAIPRITTPTGFPQAIPYGFCAKQNT